MRHLRCDISKIIFHGLAVIAVLLFVAPLEAAHSETKIGPAVEWKGGHSLADAHDEHSDINDHNSLDTLQGHCDPGPDCSNSYAVFSSIGMTVVSSGFHSLEGETVNLSTGLITTNDIPPPKHIS